MSEPPREPAGALEPRPAGRGSWWRLLMPAAPDVVALLVAQSELTVIGTWQFGVISGQIGGSL